jgi:hypothetical protein
MKRIKATGYSPATLRKRLESQLDEVRLMVQDGRMDPDFGAQVEMGLLIALKPWA